MNCFNHHPLAMRAALAAVLLGALAGCQSLNDTLQGDHVNYQVAGSAPKLAVPPDLTSPHIDQHFIAPPETSDLGVPQQRAATPAGNLVLATPTSNDPYGMHVDMDGTQHWLVVDGRNPSQLWTQLTDFWQANGFAIVTSSTNTGVMETDWAQKMESQDWFHRTFAKFIDTSGIQDKFRTRLERNPDGSTSIYVTHFRMEEMNVGSDGSSSRWVDTPRDPKLEVGILGLMMQKLGLTAAQADQLVANAKPPVDRVALVDNQAGQPTLSLSDPFERAWLRVGLALDRTDFVVDNRDRDKGIYYVRYSNPAQDIKKQGFLGKLFYGRDKPRQFMIGVKPVGDNATQIAVLDDNGAIDTSSAAQQLVSALHAQLN